ncbi:MAG: c-type cytochrome [Flavobacteriales bacterium]|nr:c-type cytochrome [Flavobacteriales bacterium]
MSTERKTSVRWPLLMLLAGTAAPLFAQEPASTDVVGEPLFTVDNASIYALVALAVVQAVFIFSLSSIMRTLGGPGGWAKQLARKTGRGLVLIPLLLLASSDAQAQAYQGDGGTISAYHTFWFLVALNLFLFMVILVQVNLVKGITRAITGADEVSSETAAVTGPTWEQRILQRFTRQVAIEKEQDILMHHEYDGIRELDNVLPPWWVWLFYGTIIWSVVYLVNVHVIDIWPDQRTEYTNEMAQAKEDIAIYTAKLGASVDENTIVASTDPGMIASGKAVFTQYCTPCHGADAAGSETSVGPNLTDNHWLHGGGAKNIFRTIKYGVPEKGMISWKSQLKPAEMASLVNYILSLAGTGPATQKAPQGDIWKEEAAPTDSTTTATDSTQVIADTLKLAAN